MSGNNSYKIWQSLTEPLIFKGLPIEYVFVILVVTGFVGMIPVAPFWLVAIVFLSISIMGIVLTRRDRRWFAISHVLLMTVGIRAFRRIRYVR